MPTNLDQLFRLYHRDLQHIAYRRLGDRELAADLAQDTFVRYAGMGDASIAQPKFFLMRLLRNLVIDVVRRRKRVGEHSALQDVENELLDPRPNPEQLLELRRQLELLREALDELPSNCRQALLLNRMDGLGHAAIAERLGVSPSMVSKYIMRGLRHCVRRLA
ncbi:RNA polymerase sigma factor [Pseudomonas putida]|uniref:RNA polymerase sigma factor n=1 Tax=Pseudomonas putida TaxID=303 RepID=A0A4D6X743_PSEPU|nr:RNA polymerase sigma factor [Pseudomonas putida]QCI11572.1 RNA polymerase sigma factor [Pseudomonas putida]